jgi:hypothetical protein
MVTTLQRKIYNLDMLRDEVRELVDRGVVHRQQPIHTLCRYIPEREWECIEVNLEDSEYLLCDRVIDLLAQERWEED